MLTCKHKECGKKQNLVQCKTCKKLVCIECVTDHAFECCFEPGVMYKTW